MRQSPMGMCTIPSLQMIVLLLCIPMVGLRVRVIRVLLSSSHGDSVSSVLLLRMEPRLAPLGRPTLTTGPIGNLAIW
jgi:hypothetical protein